MEDSTFAKLNQGWNKSDFENDPSKDLSPGLKDTTVVGLPKENPFYLTPEDKNKLARQIRQQLVETDYSDEVALDNVCEIARDILKRNRPNIELTSQHEEWIETFVKKYILV